MPSSDKLRYLFVSQVYPPDPAAVGQYLAETAEELVRRGHDVWVVTSDRGYDDPTAKLARREDRAGVRVLRLPFTSFGKGSLGTRLLGALSLLAQASAVGAFLPKLTNVVVTTSPPMGAAAGLALHRLRGVPFDFWLMDLNPDQAIALGHARAGSVGARLFERLNRKLLDRARTIVTLDDAMAARFSAKTAAQRTVRVLPLWPLDPASGDPRSSDNPFSQRHGLSGHRVVMYAGNHSIAHPLDTLVEAARRFDASSPLRFVFAGGGLAKRAIDEWVSAERPAHVLSVPYEPVERLGDLLAAAAVHVVAVGPKTVGIVHPSKLYGALAAGRPVLVLGPREAPAARLVLEHEVGWQIDHGEVGELTALLGRIAAMRDAELEALGRRARALAMGPLSRTHMLKTLCDWLEGNGYR